MLACHYEAALANGPVAWTAERAYATEPGAGVRWDWPELGKGGAAAWGWQRFDMTATDGSPAGSWVTWVPRDFAVQVVGPALIGQCQAAFVRGATACSIESDGLAFTLEPAGRVQMSPSQRALAAQFRPTAVVHSTRAVGRTVEWIETDGVRMDLNAALPE